MTRDETVALFLECETKRAEARAAGKSDEEAHEAAKAHWNAWAKKMLDERKAMEADGRWAVDLFGSLWPKNEETLAWMKKAAADFSDVRFESAASVRAERSIPEAAFATLGLHRAEAPRDDAPAATQPPVKSIQFEAGSIDFSGFIFPGGAEFESATFTGDALFESATFTGYAVFGSATFTGGTSF